MKPIIKQDNTIVSNPPLINPIMTKHDRTNKFNK